MTRSRMSATSSSSRPHVSPTITISRQCWFRSATSRGWAVSTRTRPSCMLRSLARPSASACGPGASCSPCTTRSAWPRSGRWSTTSRVGAWSFRSPRGGTRMTSSSSPGAMPTGMRPCSAASTRYADCGRARPSRPPVGPGKPSRCGSNLPPCSGPSPSGSPPREIQKPSPGPASWARTSSPTSWTRTSRSWAERSPCTATHARAMGTTRRAAASPSCSTPSSGTMSMTCARRFAGRTRGT